MNKFIINITKAMAVIMISCFTGCTDILDTAPYNALASGSMWLTEEAVDQGVAGVYNALRDWAPGEYADTYVNNNTTSWGTGSTYGFERWGVSGQLTYAEALTNGTINPANIRFSATWRKLYEGIHRANDALANIPQKSPATSEKNARLIAEVKFLRAYFYFRLNELYGRDGLGVPVYTDPVSVDECIRTQSPEDEVWALIVQDLTDAIEEPNLPDKAANGRVSKGAAYALRGKAYLYQGAKYGVDGSIAKNDELLLKAIADFDMVGQCGYALFQGDYKSLFTVANENDDEMVFSIQRTGDRYYGTSSQLVLGTRSAYSATGEGWATLSASPAGIDLYEYADGTPFSWDDIIPGFSAITEASDRVVYFLRDTHDADGNIILQAGNNLPLVATVRNTITTFLNAASEPARNDYLPYGNEARLRSVFENRDPRLEATFITPYASFLGGYGFSGAGNVLEVFWRFPVDNFNARPDASQRNDMSTGTASGDYVPYFFRKFVYEGVELSRREDGPLNEPLIRYANVLLWQAEAYVELNELEKAEINVRQVRDRAGVTTIAGHFSNQSSARNYVRDERRREFAGEGVNFFDEMHWRTWNETKFRNNTGGMQSVWGNIKNPYRWPGNHLYIWPVPQTEIEMNPSLKRTPGWTY